MLPTYLLSTYLEVGTEPSLHFLQTAEADFSRARPTARGQRRRDGYRSIDPVIGEGGAFFSGVVAAFFVDGSCLLVRWMQWP